MSYYTPQKQPQNNRNLPAIETIEAVDVTPTYEITGSRQRTDWGLVIVQLGGKALDKSGDITGLLIVHGFRFMGTVVKTFGMCFVAIVQFVWDKWTYIPPPPPQDNYRDNGGHQHTTIINNHYHYD